MQNIQTLDELLAQQTEIANKIAELRLQKHAEAVTQARALITQFGLTQDDLFGGVRAAKKSKPDGTKVPAKYRDPVGGKEWTGRGVAPAWIRDQDKSKFLIAESK